MSTRADRRRFLGQAAVWAGAAAGLAIFPRHVLGGPRHVAPSEKMNIAGIGIGGMGGGNLRQLETENIVALCDVDPGDAANTVKRYPQAKFYLDYRQMLDRQKDIDGVLIATPDHTHAVISVAAMRAGKHVYCQKPLTHDVYESRRMAQVAKECKVATQMGIQGHSMEGLRLISEWVQSGVIGEVREVDAWCNVSYYPWGHTYWSSKYGAARPQDTPPVPSTLDWDLRRIQIGRAHV